MRRINLPKAPVASCVIVGLSSSAHVTHQRDSWRGRRTFVAKLERSWVEP